MIIKESFINYFQYSTERAAYGASTFKGKNDKNGADQAAVNEMRAVLNNINMKGKIVIGEGEMDNAPMLYINEKVGTNSGDEFDIAVDPLEGTNFTAKNLPNALSVLAIAEKGNLLRAPDMYMEKIAIGRDFPKNIIDLDFGIEKNIDDALIIFMGDCSDDPNDIVQYIKYLDEGYDCVFGSRFINGSSLKDYPFLKFIINRLANNFVKILFWIKYNDITNAFKAYKKETLNSCQPIISQHFNINAELSLKSIIRGFKYKVIPISWTNRKEGMSKFHIKEMRNRYFFIIFYIFLEKFLMKEDISKDKKY